MATVNPPRIYTSAETHRRVRHPLETLRGYLRTYVSLEGLAVLAVYLALWFWIGLALDFGFFKLFTVDWVQELPWGFRAGVLAVLVAGLLAVVATKVVLRLTREFRDDALALVLERRFPQQLGDRLITAVELADIPRAERYGYSGPMIEQTIEEAAVRVERLPVKEVFDWKRLVNLWVWVVGLTLGVYLLVGAAYAGARSLWPDWLRTSFVSGFNETATIWFERNILLRNTIWPRRAHLELIGFPEGGEMKIGRDAPPPTLRVRALKWVIADPAAPEGWRALRWADLTPELAGGPVPDVTLPGDWTARDRDAGLTLDEIELQLEKPEAHRTLAAETKEALRGTLERLEGRAAEPGMRRTLRLLEVPERVVVIYKNSTSRSEMTLQKQGDNEYSGTFSELKETVRFTANGEDYYTPYRQITVVPPPGLITLTRDEERPAYLYYYPPVGGSADDLRGKRQLFAGSGVSLTGETSRVDVPAGTGVLLTAKADKDLTGVELLPPRKGVEPRPEKAELLDPQTFRVRFAGVRSPVEFVFQFRDTDGVLGTRHVFIKPLEDLTPDVEVQPDVIRKTNQGYLATVQALLPFAGKVRDDHGLDAVEFHYTLARVESGPARTSPAASVAAAAGLAAGLPAAAGVAQAAAGAEQFLPVALYVTLQTREARPKDDKGPERVAVAGFAGRLAERKQKEPVHRPQLQDLLRQDARAAAPGSRPSMNLLKEYVLDSEDPQSESGFDVQKLPQRLAVDPAREIQPRYRLQLWVAATDNDVESGPHTGLSREKFTFILVAENELLAEIAKETEGLHLKLADAAARLEDARKKRLDPVNNDLATGVKPDRFNGMLVEVEDLLQTFDKSQSAAAEVFNDYRRILREMKTNRVNEDMIKKTEKGVVEPLEDLLRPEAGDGSFARAHQALEGLHKSLESAESNLDKKTTEARAAGAEARRQLDLLVGRLGRVLSDMESITTLNELIKRLNAIEQDQRAQYEAFARLKKQLEDDLFNKVLGGDDDKKPSKP